jgi:flagellar motor switch protein FliN/FliY
MTSSTIPVQAGPLTELIVAAADAVTSVLPLDRTLRAGTPVSDPTALAVAGRAVCARLSGDHEGEVAVVLSDELVVALRNAPAGELELASAVQPALEALAGPLGSVRVSRAQEMDPDVALRSLRAMRQAAFVPLSSGDTVLAVLGIGISGPGGAAAANAVEPLLPGLDLLHGVEMEVTAELGRTRMTVRELLSLSTGAVIELDRTAGAPADLLVNGRLIARGEVVVIDENFGIRITELVAGSRGSDGQ